MHGEYNCKSEGTKQLARNQTRHWFFYRRSSTCWWLKIEKYKNRNCRLYYKHTPNDRQCTKVNKKQNNFLFYFENNLRITHIDLYIFSPLGPTCWFCRRVFTKSKGNTHDTPMIPAIPPFMIFGKSLKNLLVLVNDGQTCTFSLCICFPQLVETFICEWCCLWKSCKGWSIYTTLTISHSNL